MLVLARKKNESIRIGDHVELKVIGIRGNRIRLGIETPPEVSVMREELLEGDAAELPDSARTTPKPGTAPSEDKRRCSSLSGIPPSIGTITSPR